MNPLRHPRVRFWSELWRWVRAPHHRSKPRNMYITWNKTRDTAVMDRGNGRLYVLTIGKDGVPIIAFLAKPDASPDLRPGEVSGHYIPEGPHNIAHHLDAMMACRYSDTSTQAEQNAPQHLD